MVRVLVADDFLVNRVQLINMLHTLVDLDIQIINCAENSREAILLIAQQKLFCLIFCRAPMTDAIMAFPELRYPGQYLHQPVRWARQLFQVSFGTGISVRFHELVCINLPYILISFPLPIALAVLIFSIDSA